MNYILQEIKDNWQRYSIDGFFLLVIGYILTFRISRFTSGASSYEVSYVSSNQSLSSIFNNPVFLPHRLAGFLSHELGKHGLIAMRSISVIFGAASIYLLYTIIKKWHTKRVAFMTSTLFACSSWFLTNARHAGPQILMTFSVLVVLLGLFWVIGSKKNKSPIRILVGGLLIELLFFVPFILILSIVLAIIYRRDLEDAYWQLKPKWRKVIPFVWISVFVLFLTLCATNMTFTKTIIGLEPFTKNPTTIFKNGFWTIWGLFFKSKQNNEFNLGTLPLLDAFASAMVFLGAYFYLILHSQLRRTYALLISGVILVFVVSLSGILGDSAVLLPFVYIGVAAGITVLLGQWFTVFPRNPLARSVGVSLVTLLISISSMYHLTRYFIAFRYAPETKNVYSHALTTQK